MSTNWLELSTHQLHNSRRDVILGTVICSVFTFWLLKEQYPWVIQLWLASFSGVLISIYYFFSYFDFLFPHYKKNYSLKINTYLFLLFLGWAHWGYISIFIYPTTPTNISMFIAILVAGLSAGSVTVFLPSRRIVFCALTSILIPFAIGSYLHTLEFSKTLSVVTLLYCAVLLRAANQLHNVLYKQYVLALKNKNLLEELDAKNKDISENAKKAIVGDMASGLAHEVNNPLMTLMLEVELLEKKISHDKQIPTEKFLETFSHLKKNINRILEITKKLSHLYTKMKLEEFENIPFTKLIDSTLTSLNEQISTNAIAVETKIKTHQHLHCDPKEFSYALENIITNAIEACKDIQNERWIKLEADSKNEHIEIRIENNGPQIPKDQLEKIMHPFFSTRTLSGKLGLGLPIANSIIRNHRGSLSIDPSAPHTTFIIQMPIDIPTVAERSQV